MNIVLVIDQYTSEVDVSKKIGSAAWATRYVEGLRSHGYKVTVIATGKPEKDKVCVPTKIFPIIDPLISAQSMVFGRSDDDKVREALKDVDIVHLELPFKLCMRVREIAEEMGVPYIASFHCQPENISYNIGMKYLPTIIPSLYRWMNNRFYRHIDHIHCPSNFIANQLKKHNYKATLHVVSNGVDEIFIKKDIEKSPQFKDKFVIIMVGRLSAEKRQDLIIKAVLKSKYKDKIQVVFPGQGPKLKLYKRLGKKLKNPPVFGFYDKFELAKILNQCDLYVHAAEVEIEAVACAEAFSCGLVPIISDSKKSATSQFAIDERNLFKNKNVSDLRDKIDYMIEHPEELAELKTKYLKKSEKYRISDSIKQMINLYGKIITEKELETKHAGDMDKHKIHLPQTRSLNLTPDYKFVIRNVFFLLISFMFRYLVVYPLLYPIAKLLLGFKIEGASNIKKFKDGAITVANHVHVLDGPLLNFALFPKILIMTSIKGNFETPVVRFLIRILNAVPIPETPKTLHAFMLAMKKELGRKRLIHFYPETALWPGHTELRPFKKGAFHLAVISRKPIVPLVIKPRVPKGIFKLFKKKPCITVEIGSPVDVPKNGSNKEKTIILRDKVFGIMQEMLKDESSQNKTMEWDKKSASI